MSKVECGISITPDKQNKKEALILDFLAVTQQEGALNQLDERSRNLIDTYFKTGATLESLKEVAGVGTRERVRQLIMSGIERLWETLPPSLQESYPQEEVIAMLHSASRAKIGEATSKRRKGRKETPKTRAKMSEVNKAHWQDPEYRAKMSEVRKAWWANHKKSKDGPDF